MSDRAKYLDLVGHLKDLSEWLEAIAALIGATHWPEYLTRRRFEDPGKTHTRFTTNNGKDGAANMTKLAAASCLQHTPTHDPRGSIDAVSSQLSSVALAADHDSRSLQSERWTDDHFDAEYRSRSRAEQTSSLRTSKHLVKYHIFGHRST